MSRPSPRGSLVLLILRVALAGVFLFSAYVKLKPGPNPAVSGPQQFALSLKSFEILPDHLVQIGTYAVPWTEAIVGLLLLAGLWTRPAAWLLALTLASFVAAIVSVLERGMNVECGCFGRYTLMCPKGKLGWCNVIQNGILLAMTLPVAVRGSGRFALAPDPRPGRS